MIEDYTGQRVTVMGLGRFGGGVGVTRFLAERGADVRVTDTLPPEDLKDSVAQLADLEAKGVVSYRLGGHNVSDFTTCDLLVVNPAVKPGNRFVRAARAAGVPVTSEIRLVVKHLPNRLRTIGVTGSAGKSTTTAMIAHILRKVLGQEGETPLGEEGVVPRRQDAKAPRREVDGPGVWMGGNIGGSLLPFVELIRDDDWVVLELSSFMLEGLREDEWSPHVAVITNISPNHLDWHGSMENYVAAKQALCAFQGEADWAVVPQALREQLKVLAKGWGPPFEIHGEPRPSGFSIPGEHNLENAWVAGHAVYFGQGTNVLLGLSMLTEFSGLPHRLEYVGEFPGDGGVKCYNDSKSTTPEAAALAIDSFDPGAVRIILGGYDKGSDFGELAELAAQCCVGVYTIGATGSAIGELIPGAVRCGTLDVAVGRALGDARAGEVLVLSPGCASWDQFANYEERGARFIELVKAWGETQKPTD
ncbi:MAG: UDP-N-acetylmuramoyl-L-alanine--D-glutamate ligase [Planctomycetota bacterium]